MKQIIILFSLFFPPFIFGIEGGFGADFYKLNAEQRIEIFSQKINQMLDHSFEEVLREKKFVDEFFQKNAKEGFRKIEHSQMEKLIEIKNKYRIENLFDYQEYKKRIGTIPKSMGIAQAMIESATGTSRFTKEANNLFGQWTWKGKGLVPRKRDKDKNHKIKIFDNIQESVDAYVLNINRHFAYEDFRKLRLSYENKNEKLTGLKAIKTLHNYSELKGEYVKRLQNLINKYELSRFDK